MPSILEAMTAATESSSPAALAPDSDVLRAHLLRADPGVLVAVLAQMTGDTTVIDRYAPKIDHVPDPPERAGTTDADTMRALVEEVVAALGRARTTDAPPAHDRDLFVRLLPIALGSEVSDEHVDLLIEQGGFRPSQPTLPRTTPIPSTTSVAIIGAGLAGIAVALAAAEEDVQFQIFERNSEVGGTWLTTNYPGIGVDTPSAYYSLSREVNPDWSSYYPQGAEYQAYLVALADKHDLRRHTRFNTEVEALWWDEQRQQWQIRSRNGDGAETVDYARVVVTAAGYLNRPRFPDLKGRESFGGISIHSAQWDPELDLAGKKVAIIGAGCTAVQIVDACVEDVDHLTVFQRQPHWVAPRKRQSDDVPEHRRYLGHALPFYAMWHRVKSYWATADNNYPVILQDPEWSKTHLSISPANDVLLQMCQEYIDRMFGAGTELAKKVTPDFAPYGKRIIRDPGGYYAALARDHVDVEASEPAEVNANGIVTVDGRQIDLDVIIYATGYHLDFLSTVDIRGRDGRTLSDEWGESPRAYRGGTVPGFPNLFITSAPNYSPGHGAGANFSMEVLAHYIVECLQLMALRGTSTIEVTQRAHDEYVAGIDELMQGTVWCHTPKAHTYYRSGSGRVVVATPYRLVDLWQQHRAPIEEDFILR
jgi:cation diffusion facilitator CzcD-associated flavoprotein CzcO